MAAGGLRKRVTFQKSVETPDGGGGYSASWSNDLTVWGGFQPERGSERFAADRLEASVGGILTVRSSSETRAISEAWRVLIDGEPYQIRSIINRDQRNRKLEMVVERGVAD